SYHGGSGLDTLITPVDLATLTAIGVTVTSFEVITVDPALSLLSECSGCGCEVIAGAIECCSGHGVCDESDGDVMACTCDPGFAGDDCSIECADGEPCRVHVYRNADGTTLGLEMLGDVFFPDTDQGPALAAFRQLVHAHPRLFRLAPIDTAALT